MTRKDYVAIAAALKEARENILQGMSNTRAREQQQAHDAEKIAFVMARDNPRFDRARFLKACGVQS